MMFLIFRSLNDFVIALLENKTDVALKIGHHLGICGRPIFVGIIFYSYLIFFENQNNVVV